jgi:hypothetical protein
MPTTQIAWLPTRDAAIALGRSTSYLKRLRDSHGGFLQSGKHYATAPSVNATICWNVPEIRDALNRRGMALRQSQRLIDKVQTTLQPVNEKGA